MKERATVAAIATSIAIVKAVVNSGEKVFNAYMMCSPFVFELLLVIGVSARLFSFCSSVVNRNEWGIASSRYGCTIGAKNNGVKFFFKFFFVGCGARGCVGVGVRCVGVGRRDRDGAGWMDTGWGYGWGLAGWNDESSSQGVPIPDSDCRLGCDR